MPYVDAKKLAFQHGIKDKDSQKWLESKKASTFSLVWLNKQYLEGVGDRSDQRKMYVAPAAGDVLICDETLLYGVVAVVAKRSLGEDEDFRVLVVKLTREKFGEVTHELPPR